MVSKMNQANFEEQLRIYKENLHPITKNLFYPRGEAEIDYVARSLSTLMQNKICLDRLLEIYAFTLGMLKLDKQCFPFEAYSSAMNRYGEDIDRHDLILIISFIRFGADTLQANIVSDEKQGSIYRDIFELNRQFDIIINNSKGDEMVGAYGRFGYDKTNPIPVRGFRGIHNYFSRLRTFDDEGVTYKRIGAYSEENIKGPIDGYLINESVERENVIFLNIYNDRTSDKAPEGYILI